MKILGSFLALAGMAVLGLTQSAHSEVVNPGGEEALGRLVVKLPDNAPKEVGPFTVFFGSKRQKLGVPSDRVLAGKHCIYLVTHKSNDGESKVSQIEDCSVQIDRGKTTTYTLSLVKLEYTHPKLPTVPKSMFGNPYTYYYGTLSAYWNAKGAGKNVTLPLSEGLSGSDGYYRAVLSGDLHVTLPYPSGAPTKVIPLPSGSVSTIPLVWGTPSYPKMGEIVVKMPKRLLPTSSSVVLFHCRSNAAHCHSMSDRLGLDTTKDHLVTAYEANAGSYYALDLSHLTGQMPAYRKLEVEADKKLEVTFKHIDVNHPVVTKEDGTTYTAKGNYRIARKHDDGKWYFYRTVNSSSAVSFNTGTGVDLFPGEYRVTVNFVTAEGHEEKNYFLELTDAKVAQSAMLSPNAQL